MHFRSLYKILLSCTITLIYAGTYESHAGFPAIIKDPVADMSISLPIPHNAPASPETVSCRRAHQGLYNELVEWLEENGDNVKIQYHNIIYGFDDATQKPLSTFWVNKKHVALLESIVLTEAFYAIPHKGYAQEPTVVITYPWNNLSVGTRLVHFPAYDTEESYAILLGNYTEGTCTSHHIPHTHALCEVAHTEQEARIAFVTLINTLLDCIQQEKPAVIPYVWGGSSFVHAHSPADFYQEDGVWQRILEHECYTGYDCSEFVMRMAQIAGIPFAWKTSKVISEQCTPYSTTDIVQEGDLIWFPGHVMIISNIEHNEIIEARGYTSGYGCVHRIPLSECFDGISTFQELLEAYHQKKPLSLLNKAGVIARTYPQFKILKLC